MNITTKIDDLLIMHQRFFGLSFATLNYITPLPTATKILYPKTKNQPLYKTFLTQLYFRRCKMVHFILSRRDSGFVAKRVFEIFVP